MVTALMLALVFWAASVQASNRKAAEYVRQGIRHFRAGEMQAAEHAFAEADVALPDNPRIGFDRACVLSATGDTDRATELLRESAMSREPELVSQSRYNLGSIQAAKGKAVFGDHPEEASPEVRQEGLRLLAGAIGHWRDCLEVDPSHAPARHNLEVVRLWIKHMQEVWAQRDRDKAREEADLLSLLLMIEGQQTQLRESAKQLAGQQDSPRRRQSAKQAGRAQLELADDVKPLKEKFEQLFEPPGGGGQAPGPAPNDPQRQQALGALNEMANRARSAMLKAAGNLEECDLASTITSQLDALDSLNEIYMAVAPFQNVLQRSIATEEPLVTASQDIVQWSAESGDADVEQPDVDYEELARRQTQIHQWSQVLPLKAEQQREQQQAPPERMEDSTADPQATGQPTDQPAVKAMEAMEQALEKAIELAPQVQALTTEAAESLGERDAETAKPKQEEALALLKEIADLLPKQDQQQDQGQEDQQQDRENQDDQQGSSGDDSQQQQRPQQEPSQVQAEAVLRKARERERERKDRQKQLQRYLRGGTNVDRDW